MTTITSNYTKARSSKSDSALLLIDHQSGIMQLNRDYSPAEYRNNLGLLVERRHTMKHTSIPTNGSEQKFGRGIGTGEPTAEIARLLNLMKLVDHAFNLRDYDRFLNQLHSEDVKVIQFGSENTLGRPPHRNVIEETLAAFPDMRVHNDHGKGQRHVHQTNANTRRRDDRTHRKVL
jgi:hypothetical protein